jgi:predicted transcriptional regulator
MVRTQIQLTEWQATALKHLATRRKQSMAEIIRQSIERFLAIETNAEDNFQQIQQLAILEPGLFHSGLPDLGRNHDKYLVEAYSNGLYREPYSDEPSEK